MIPEKEKVALGLNKTGSPIAGWSWKVMLVLSQQWWSKQQSTSHPLFTYLPYWRISDLNIGCLGKVKPWWLNGQWIPRKTEKFFGDLVLAPIHAGRYLSVHSNVMCNSRLLAESWQRWWQYMQKLPRAWARLMRSEQHCIRYIYALCTTFRQ